MKGTGFFRRLLCVLLVSLLIIPFALADKVDLSSMSDDEIVELMKQVNQEIVDRRINKTAKMAPGTYTGGKDIPVGKYIFTCTATGNDWGNMFVYNKEGKQVEWEVVSAPEQGQEPQTSFITLEKDYTLKCSTPFTLTIMAGAVFE